MKPLEDAYQEVLSAIEQTEVVDVSVFDARGLVLAEPVVAPHDVPPFTNSAMDGYAVKAADIASAPVRLPVLEDVAAGHVASGALQTGCAIKIMTGAPLPEGADTIVRVEDTIPAEDSVEILIPTAYGTAVREAGGDVLANDLVFEAGERLTARHLAVLASLGVRPRVRRRPRVGIISTGDEVLDPQTPVLAPGQIRDTNRPILSGLLSELGTDVTDYGIVRDDADRLQSVIEQAAADNDAIFTSGGVSMGEYDLVKQVLGTLGEVDLWRIAMQPAKPFAFGLVNGTPLFGLPGNPVSVAVAFEQFARPGLLHMMGGVQLYRPRVSGTLKESVSTDPEKTVFLRASAVWRNGAWTASLSGGQSSNVLTALARGNCFVVSERGRGDIENGETVELEMFTWPEERTLSQAREGTHV
jgi:molybdopterin molybdotransferase